MSPREGVHPSGGEKIEAVPRGAGIRHRDPAPEGPGVLSAPASFN